MITLSDQFLLDSYSGKGGFASGQYLVRHPRETDAKYEVRQTLAIYPNFARKVVDNYMGFLWRQTPTRESGDLYEQFASDADGSGHSLNHLMASYQRLAMLLGTVYVIVDKAADVPLTRATEPLPYLALRLPGQLVKQKQGASGAWQSVTFSELLNRETVYRTFALDGWVLSADAEGRRVIDSGQYSLGRVPVVRLHAAIPLQPTDVRAESWASDLAQLNWDLYNQRSEMRELFRAQTFSILALPIREEQDRERLQDMTISTENALTYDPENGGMPFYLAPPDGPVTVYMEQIAATVQDIYRVANLEFVGGVQQSGVALSFHFQEANATLVTMADMTEQAEREIAELVHLWQGIGDEVHIAYPMDFNLTDLAQALAQALDAVSLSISPAFDKALKKRLSRQILGSDASPSVLNEIDDEIDAQGDVFADRARREAEGPA